jgi:UDP-glucuronate decarboxylase
MKSKKPILITGGDGFIGKSLVTRFLKLKIPVIVIDNNITSYPQNIQDKSFKRITEDISKINISAIPQVSGIIHLASVASPLLYMKTPSLVLEPNVFGTKKMIDVAKRDNARILFASTSEVYGHLNEDLVDNEGIKEDDDAVVTLLSKRSCYAAAKRLGEEFINEYKMEGGNASNFRLFNVYGPGMDQKNRGYGRVIPNFFHNMSKGKPIQIFGDGKQIRSFLWIDDAIDAILSLYFLEQEPPNVVNIGNDEPVTILNLASRISKILDKAYQIEFNNREPDDPLWRRPCIKRINKVSGWKPKIAIDEGLMRTHLDEEID